MNVRRGDGVLVQYPFASGAGSSRRPALIVQNDRDNRALTQYDSRSNYDESQPGWRLAASVRRSEHG
jgi:hypothetical protein